MTFDPAILDFYLQLVMNPWALCLVVGGAQIIIAGRGI